MGDLVWLAVAVGDVVAGALEVVAVNTDGRSREARAIRKEMRALQIIRERDGIPPLPPTDTPAQRLAVYEAALVALQKHGRLVATAIGALDVVVRDCYEQIGRARVRAELPPSADAVDPSATDTGTPPTRGSSSSSS